ncbi:hypothetical protein BUE80_DR006941 [Diplocarpon rosae]|nr:hypothetical protein BUE80_DR006941 [Diplocarpon rosae]
MIPCAYATYIVLRRVFARRHLQCTAHVKYHQVRPTSDSPAEDHIVLLVSQTAMATPPAPSSSVAETLARLSTKSGVIATLAMDGKTATVLQSMGTVATMFASNADASHAFSATAATAVHPSLELGGSAPAIPSPLSPEDQAVETFAKMVWNYVNATRQLVHDMDSEDEVKLLRLRTRKHELVIVPDSKYIFVVVHDVPSS